MTQQQGGDSSLQEQPVYGIFGSPSGSQEEVFWDIAPTYLSFFFLGESVLPPDTVRGSNPVHR